MRPVNCLVAAATLAMLPAAGQSQDWSGPYGGLSVADTQGTLQPLGGPRLDVGGTQVGGFLGYNLQSGAFVYGGELALVSGKAELDVVPGQGVDRFVDLKARAGYATGAYLVYGVLGYSTDRVFIPGDSSRGSGTSYGVGVDLMVSPQLFVGAEYLHRSFSNDGTFDIRPVDGETDSLSLRFGMTF